MLFWIIQITIISIILIFLVHYLFNFFKETLTVPKIKDLVNSSDKKYQKIYDTISNQTATNASPNSYTSIDLLPSSLQNEVADQSSMKDELKSFLKKQLKSEKDTDIMGIGSSSNFSAF